MILDKHGCKQLFNVKKSAFEVEVRQGSNKYSRLSIVLGDALPVPPMPFEIVIDAFCYRLYNSSHMRNKKHPERWMKIIDICLEHTTSKGVGKYYKKDLPTDIWSLLPNVCKKPDDRGMFVLPTDIIHSLDKAILKTSRVKTIDVLNGHRDHFLNLDEVTFLRQTYNGVGIVKERLPHISEAIANPNDIDVSLFKECYDFVDGDVDALLLHLIEEYDGGGKVAKKILTNLKSMYEVSSIGQIVSNNLTAG